MSKPPLEMRIAETCFSNCHYDRRGRRAVTLKIENVGKGHAKPCIIRSDFYRMTGSCLRGGKITLAGNQVTQPRKDMRVGTALPNEPLDDGERFFNLAVPLGQPREHKTVMRDLWSQLYGAAKGYFGSRHVAGAAQEIPKSRVNLRVAILA
ncbi:MAG TPA: hypothetical protein VM782_13250, partial [Stellaceae bacterium]|nr:hypothetical protein [Stellaceae bacterium]